MTLTFVMSSGSRAVLVDNLFVSHPGKFTFNVKCSN